MANDLTNYDEAYAKAAAQYVNQHPLSGGTFLSTRAGVLSFGEEQLPGNQMAVVILDSILENTYYAERFDPDNPSAPTCYAFGRRKDEMAPHESMQSSPEYFVPQHSECKGCPHDQWGSADTGRGKACQNRARLALIPAGFYSQPKGSRELTLDLFTDAAHFANAEVAFLKVPPTSVTEEWGKYVAQLQTAHRRPPFAFITRVYLQPHPKHQYHVKFEMLEPLPDELSPIIFRRHEEAAANIITPYSPPQEREQAPRAGLRGLRR